MSDKSTNQQIAELLKGQTVSERKEMAAAFRDMAIDATADGVDLGLNWFADALENWADAELEAAEQP